MNIFSKEKRGGLLTGMALLAFGQDLKAQELSSLRAECSPIIDVTPNNIITEDVIVGGITFPLSFAYAGADDSDDALPWETLKPFLPQNMHVSSSNPPTPEASLRLSLSLTDAAKQAFLGLVAQSYYLNKNKIAQAYPLNLDEADIRANYEALFSVEGGRVDYPDVQDAYDRYAASARVTQALTACLTPPRLP